MMERNSMNIALILAAGVGQRMRNGGLPKQFLKLMGKPIIIYTLEKFEQCDDIDKIVIACHGSYVEYLQNLLQMFQIKKVDKVVVGGTDRQSSIVKGLDTIHSMGAQEEDIVVIHDGVRPLVDSRTIRENIRVAKEYGCAITVHPVTESVVITEGEKAGINNFMKRADTYSMTAPQSFVFGKLQEAYNEIDTIKEDGLPLLDAGMVYSKVHGDVQLVKEQGTNIKITTPEDFYYLKAILDLEENKYIFGL